VEIVFRQETAVTVAEISGSVDGLTSTALLTALGDEVKKGHIRLVADFAKVDYISSAGLRALLGTVKEARGQGGDFRLAGVTPPVKKVLELSGFTSILKLFPDAAAAVASFGA
jgi:anti-anti-sigma factor